MTKPTTYLMLPPSGPGFAPPLPGRSGSAPASTSAPDAPLVEAEVSATIKLVLSLLEAASREAPHMALEPVQFNERRRAVIRRLWHLAKLASRLDEPLP